MDLRSFLAAGLNLHQFAGVLAHEWALQDLENAWQEGRLVDNLPALVIANERQIPEEVRQKVLKAHLRDARTGLFHTHPCDEDCIASARFTPFLKLLPILSRTPFG